MTWRSLALAVKWFFTYHGMSKPPTPLQMLMWARLGKPVYKRKCSVCGSYYWTPKKSSICPRLKCHLKAGGVLCR